MASSSISKASPMTGSLYLMPGILVLCQNNEPLYGKSIKLKSPRDNSANPESEIHHLVAFSPFMLEKLPSSEKGAFNYISRSFSKDQTTLALSDF
jgi:hypothetical protein